jgi:uncharacterized protein (DUF2342 family)
MTNDPSDRPGDENNPFKGTPFEQLFSSLGGAFPGAGAGGAGMPDLSALMSQMQAMMAPHEGSVNWNLAKDVARKTVAQEPDPSPGEKDRDAVADAIRLADHWLDQVTDLPSGVSTLPCGAVPVGRGDRRGVGSGSSSRSPSMWSARWEALPEEAKTMAGPLMAMLGQAGGAMFGTRSARPSAGSAPARC